MATTEYVFKLSVPASAPGTPRPVMIAARMAKVVHDALQADGLTISGNALPYGVSVECTEMTCIDPDDPDEATEPEAT